MANRVLILIFDTSVFIDHLRTNKFADRFLNLKGLIRNSSVVLAELLRGATQPEEVDFVKTLAKNHATLSPTKNTWLESGEILWKINRDKGFPPDKLRDLHFDVLIALTARTCGAMVVTSNKSDFELIRHYRTFALEIW